MISKNGFQLSGHETFVLRRLWLPKVFRYSNKMVKAGLSPNFSGEAPMIDLGLGKNMQNRTFLNSDKYLPMKIFFDQSFLF